MLEAAHQLVTRRLYVGGRREVCVEDCGGLQQQYLRQGSNARPISLASKHVEKGVQEAMTYCQSHEQRISNPWHPQHCTSVQTGQTYSFQARGSSGPTVKHELDRQRLATCLETPRLEWVRGYQACPGLVTVEGDSDWAGDVAHRRSRGGGFEFMGGHVFDAWAAQHQQHSLSSGEAENIELVNGSAQGIFSKNLFAEMETTMELHVCTSRCRSGISIGRLESTAFGCASSLAVGVSQRTSAQHREHHRRNERNRHHDETIGSSKTYSALEAVTDEDATFEAWNGFLTSPLERWQDCLSHACLWSKDGSAQRRGAQQPAHMRPAENAFSSTIDIELPSLESNVELKPHQMNARIQVIDEQPEDAHSDMNEAATRKKPVTSITKGEGDKRNDTAESKPR